MTRQQLFFSDLGSCVFVLKLDGGFVRAFGGPGSEDGQFNMATGLAVNNHTGEVVVADYNHGSIQVRLLCTLQHRFHGLESMT